MLFGVGVDAAAGIVKNPRWLTPSAGLSGRFVCGHSGSMFERGMHIGKELDARPVGLSSSMVNRASGDVPPPKPTLKRPSGSFGLTRVFPSTVTSPVAKLMAVM